MVPNPPQLSLDFRPSYVPKTITDLFEELSTIADASERLTRLDDYINKLQDEMRKIDAFKRELPLCMLLLNDAIDAVKAESGRCREANAEPVLEEFIPLKTSCDEDGKDETKKERDCRDNKKNWLSSVQLWNSDCASGSLNCDKQSSTPHIKKKVQEVNPPVIHNLDGSCRNRIGGWPFMPFKTSYPVSATRKEDKEEEPAAGLSLVTPGIKNCRESLGSNALSSKPSVGRTGSSVPSSVQSNLRTGQQLLQQNQSARKQRRCWSPELHRRFVNALQQLGGSQAATPKQIRELMQVDGLTNDEVKSHLQKYRLHIRRLPASGANAPNQSVSLGGLWMHHQDQYNECSKQSNSNSGSPPGPLHLDRTTAGTGGDSMEDEDDVKSESHSWKSHARTAVKADV